MYTLQLIFDLLLVSVVNWYVYMWHECCISYLQEISTLLLNSSQFKIYRATYWQLWKPESNARKFCWINIGWPDTGHGQAAQRDRVRLKWSHLICLQPNWTHCVGSCNMICQIRRVAATTHNYYYTTIAESIIFSDFKTQKHTNSTPNRNVPTYCKNFHFKMIHRGRCYFLYQRWEKKH